MTTAFYLHTYKGYSIDGNTHSHIQEEITTFVFYFYTYIIRHFDTCKHEHTQNRAEHIHARITTSAFYLHTLTGTSIAVVNTIISIS